MPRLVIWSMCPSGSGVARPCQLYYLLDHGSGPAFGISLTSDFERHEGVMEATCIHGYERRKQS